MIPTLSRLRATTVARLAGAAGFLVLALTSQQGFAQAAAPRASMPVAPTGVSESAPIAPWLAWRVFHESLAYDAQHSGVVHRMLADKFGLSAADFLTLADSGARFLAAVKEIDRGAKAAVQARFGTNRPAPARLIPRGGQAASRSAQVVPAPGPTLRQMAEASGLVEQVDGKKRAALDAHVAELGASVAPAKLKWIQEWVQGPVASRIRVSDRGTPVAAPKRPAAGASGYVTRGEK